jgi:LAO/AO transport system kinase
MCPPSRVEGQSSLVDDLLPPLLERQPRALARAVSLVESGGELQRRLIGELYGRCGQARLLGVTGPPGAGKSTLVDRLARHVRERGETVGILAVDPTSPFSGGALLGDRVRMTSLYTDPGVFIRSMATRGAMGGLARATRDAIDVLDAAGFDWVFVETVGVGQDEIDVVRTVDTVAVVSQPGLGDEIQAIKAGIMEIADVFVVNKADRAGAEATERDLRSMLQMGNQERKPQIVRTVATRNEGVDDLLAAIEEHRRYLVESGLLERRRFSHLRLRVETILKERIVRTVDEVMGMERQLEQAYAEREDPYLLADRLFAAATVARAEREEAR